MKSTEGVLQNMITNYGDSVLTLSKHQEILLVFLRHFGCTFCREALKELADLSQEEKFKHVQLVLVHMSTEELASKYFMKYHLETNPRVADPECNFYQEFGLIKGTFSQLFGFRSWIRGFEAGIIKGYGFGPQLGDGFQMPGVFLISKGQIRSEFKHRFASDKPDYFNMLTCVAEQ